MTSVRRVAITLALFAVCAATLDGEAAAQARHPFAAGAAEPAASATGGISGWILAQQAEFYAALRGAVRAARSDAWAFWGLAGVAFLYGVFHAAGPGHGKAVLSSYMLANERALKRGMAISFAAAALQGLVALAIVTVGALILGATSTGMTRAAGLIETASYAAILALGLWLVWRKAGALAAEWRGEAATCEACGGRFALRYAPAAPAVGGRFAAAPAAPAALACGHAPDPAGLGGAFSWRTAATTVFAAGARPCSGAIVVLVFALAQGVFWAGAGAVAAMALGTALTTSALAAVAVLAKGAAIRLSGAGQRAALALRGLELAAAIAVAALGLGLLTGVLASGGAA
ncbi:MAG: nickel/cobalt transporter [Methylobacteriaceae bacterium]|nr:nickel/cobalt transporter [Methylobacteriaceae bacterium]